MDANELATAREYWASQNILQGSDEIEHRLSINLILDALEAAERAHDNCALSLEAMKCAWEERYLLAVKDRAAAERERDELRAAVRAAVGFVNRAVSANSRAWDDWCNLPAVKRAMEASQR